MYKDLLTKGLLLPALVYFVLTVCIAEKGGLRAILQVVPVMYLCLFWPFYYDMVCDRLMKKWTRSIGAGSHEGFRVSRSFNMLCLFVALLLFAVFRKREGWFPLLAIRLSISLIMRNWPNCA